MIEPQRQISVPVSCGPSHHDFQRGWQEASVLQKFLEAHQKCPLIYVEPLIYVAQFTPKMSVRWHIYLHQCPLRRQKSELQTRPNNGLGRRRRYGFGTILENMSYPRRCLWHKEGRRIGVAECLSRLSRSWDSWQRLCGGGSGGGGGGDRGTVHVHAPAIPAIAPTMLAVTVAAATDPNTAEQRRARRRIYCGSPAGDGPPAAHRRWQWPPCACAMPGWCAAVP